MDTRILTAHLDCNAKSLNSFVATRTNHMQANNFLLLADNDHLVHSWFLVLISHKIKEHGLEFGIVCQKSQAC